MNLEAHAHVHAHVHAHAHDGHDHGHAPAHGGHGPQRGRPGFSFLRASWGQRLLLALAVVATIWLGVLWAWA